jgi:hypothetical protein
VQNAVATTTTFNALLPMGIFSYQAVLSKLSLCSALLPLTPSA